MKRRSALHLIAAAATLPACSRVASTQSTNRNPGTQPHVLRYADGQDPVGLVTYQAAHASTTWLAGLWAAWLFRCNAKLEMTPDLCTEVPTIANGLITPDGKKITYKLRDATWSDGTPFTSADVAFSVALINDPKTIVESRDGWELIERVETPDPHTAIFHLKKTYSSWAATFFSTGGANPCIVPKHIVASQDINTGPYNSKPIGIGPFVIDEWNRGQGLTLSANTKYWRGRPKLDKIIYKIIPNDETIMTQLETHELDLYVQMNQNKLQEAQGLKGITVLRRPSVYWYHLDFNCSQPALSEVPVRQALSYAIDRETIIAKVFHGAGALKWSVIDPQSFAFNPDVMKYPFDIAKANALLDGAGWHRDAAGVRSKDGQSLHFSFVVGAGSATYTLMIELIRATWKQIGVSFDIKTFQTDLLFGPIQSGGIIQSGKFDIVAFQWGSTADPTGAVNLYSSKLIPPAGQNDLRYKNIDVTRLLEQASGSIDPAIQKRALGDAQAIIARESPTLPIAQAVALYAANTDLKGFDPNSEDPFYDMMAVDM